MMTTALSYFNPIHSGFSNLTLHSLFAILIVICTAYYVCVQLALAIGLKRLKRPSLADHPLVTVIVAARNEQDHIRLLLDSLIEQTYPEYEIIIVDDRSTDTTAHIVQSYQLLYHRVKLVRVTANRNDLPPKKNALREGILTSKGEILCFTDADCVPPKTWIASIVSYFDGETGVVAGYSPYDASMLPPDRQRGRGRMILHKFVAAEEFKSAIWSAGSIGLHVAWLCTGRNLAYRRRVFEEVGGFEKIKKSVSGDDDLFIQLVRRFTDWKIRYACFRESFVTTSPPSTFAQFIQQRTRHFSAGKFFTLPMKLFFASFHASNLILFLGLFSAIFSRGLFPLALSAFIVKLGCDWFLFFTATKTLAEKAVPEKFHPLNFLLTEILYIFYNTLIGPLGFVKTFEWKPDKTT